jgi:hypothetical protein
VPATAILTPPPVGSAPVVLGPPAPKVATTPRALRAQVRAALRARKALRFSYRAARPGTLTVKLRKGRKVVGSARVKFRRAGTRTVVIRGRPPRTAKVSAVYRY